jgi:hypothetical protein
MAGSERKVRLTVKEHERLAVIREILEGRRTQVSGARAIVVSSRWMKTLVKRVRERGEEGLVHGNCGRASNRRLKEKTRQEIADLYREKYEGFNLNHFRQMLNLREGWEEVPSRESLRGILKEAGLWTRQRRVPKHRQKRPRRECEGELLQVDASIHEWLGEGKGYLALVGGIDDATGEVPHAEFFEQETTEAYMVMLKGVIEKKGVPGALYSDRDSVFKVNNERDRERAQDKGEKAQTEFGRVMKELGIEWIEANSPQAKGRIERLWGTLQDRLLKELRLEGIQTREAANEYLRKGFLPRFNREFRKVPASQEVMYRERPLAKDLARILCWRTQRKLTGDHTFRYGSSIWQVLPHPQIRALRGKRVEVRKTLAGRIEAWWGEWRLGMRPAAPEPLRVASARLGNPVRGRVRVYR